MKLGLVKRRTNAIEPIPEFVSQKPISGYSQEDVDRIINSVTEKITQILQANIPRTPQKIQANIPKTPLITRRYSITPIQANIPKTPLITRKHSIAPPIQKLHESLDQKDEEPVDYLRLLIELMDENEIDEYLQQQAELKSQKQSH